MVAVSLDRSLGYQFAATNFNRLVQGLPQSFLCLLLAQIRNYSHISECANLQILSLRDICSVLLLRCVL